MDTITRLAEVSANMVAVVAIDQIKIQLGNDHDFDVPLLQHLLRRHTKKAVDRAWDRASASHEPSDEKWQREMCVAGIHVAKEYVCDDVIIYKTQTQHKEGTK